MIIKRPAIVIDKNPQAESFLAVATFIPIPTWGGVFKAAKLSNRVEKQLKQTPGIVAYSLAVNPLSRQFWTYSLWTDVATKADFVRAEPHASAVKLFESVAGPGAAFVEWTTQEARLRWDDAFEHLKQPTYRR